MDDMIYRQAAIDEIREDADWLESQGSDWQTERKERDFQILAGLPSVQSSFSQPYENDRSAEPCEDAVSRADMLETYADLYDVFEDNNQICKELHKVYDKLNALPSVQPKQRWIPCSERLPENGRQVLVYARSVHYALAKYDEMREADGTYKKQWVTFDAWKPFYTIKEVIAWMPLPERYRGEQK